jgi:hypothetical protein
MAPSRIMNRTWLLARLPPKPPWSSATRKEQRIRMAIAAIPVAVGGGEGGVSKVVSREKEAEGSARACKSKEQKSQGLPQRKKRNVLDFLSALEFGFTFELFRLTFQASWMQRQTNANIETT